MAAHKAQRHPSEVEGEGLDFFALIRSGSIVQKIRDVRCLADTYLAPRDKLGATHFMGVALPPILAAFCPHNVDQRPPQALCEEGMIDDRMGNNSNTSLRGCPDDVMLLGAHHLHRPGSGRQSTPRQNLIPARILGAAVGTGELLCSSVGGSAFPALPCDLAERR
jgi:hypothetical protein